MERLLVVVTGLDSGETLERWQFNVNVQDDEANKPDAPATDENGNTLNSQPPRPASAPAKKSSCGVCHSWRWRWT